MQRREEGEIRTLNAVPRHPNLISREEHLEQTGRALDELRRGPTKAVVTPDFTTKRIPREWNAWAGEPINPADIEDLREVLAATVNELTRLRRRVIELESQIPSKRTVTKGYC